jgi:hypothetical protein
LKLRNTFDIVIFSPPCNTHSRLPSSRQAARAHTTAQPPVASRLPLAARVAQQKILQANALIDFSWNGLRTIALGQADGSSSATAMLEHPENLGKASSVAQLLSGTTSRLTSSSTSTNGKPMCSTSATTASTTASGRESSPTAAAPTTAACRDGLPCPRPGLQRPAGELRPQAQHPHVPRTRRRGSPLRSATPRPAARRSSADASQHSLSSPSRTRYWRREL